jgi:hypothetical protein
MMARFRDLTFDGLPVSRMMNLQGQGIIRLLQFSGALSSDNRNVSGFVRDLREHPSRVVPRNSASRFGKTS